MPCLRWSAKYLIERTQERPAAELAEGLLAHRLPLGVPALGEGILDAGRPLYHVDRVVRETGESADNGLEELYVNALARDGDEVSALMRLFVEAEAYDEARFPETSRVKRRLRETEEGREDMGSVIEEICAKNRLEGKAEGKAEGIAEGEARGTLKTLGRLVRDGLVSVQDAAASAGVDADEIRRALAAEG